MTPGISEDGNHQVRCAVADFGLISKVGVRGNEYTQFDDAPYPPQVAKCRLHLRDQPDGAAPRRLLTASNIHRVAEPAPDETAIVGKGNLPRNVQQRIRFHRRNVIGSRRCRRREFDTERSKP